MGAGGPSENSFHAATCWRAGNVDGLVQVGRVGSGKHYGRVLHDPFLNGGCLVDFWTVFAAWAGFGGATLTGAGAWIAWVSYRRDSARRFMDALGFHWRVQNREDRIVAAEPGPVFRSCVVAVSLLGAGHIINGRLILSGCQTVEAGDSPLKRPPALLEGTSGELPDMWTRKDESVGGWLQLEAGAKDAFVAVMWPVGETWLRKRTRWAGQRVQIWADGAPVDIRVVNTSSLSGRKWRGLRPSVTDLRRVASVSTGRRVEWPR